MPGTPIQPGDTGLCWLLTMTWGGQTYRWATRDLELLDEDGNPHTYTGGLSVTYYESAYPGTASGTSSLSVRGIEIPDVAEKIEAGKNPLVRVPCVLSLWASGRTIEEAYTYLIGVATATDYGAPGEPIAFQILPTGTSPSSGSILTPPPSALVTATTWPDHAEEAEGKYYPTVIGKPGFALGARVTATNGGSPAVVVDTVNDYLLIAGHPVMAATVRVIDRTALVAGDFAVSHVQDGLGRTVAIVTLAGAVPYVPGDEYWVRWDLSDGGMPNPWRPASECLEGAGDVLRWAMGLGGVAVDTGRWLSLRDALNPYRVATYIDKPVDLWGWATRVVFPLAPLSTLTGPSGIYPVLWRHDIKTVDAVASLDVQREGLQRTTPVRYDDSRWSSVQRVRYAPRSDNGKPQKVVTLVAPSALAEHGSPEAIPSVYFEAAYSRIGSTENTPVELTGVYDPATAYKSATWRGLLYSFPHRTIEYQDVTGKFAWIRPMTPILLTDSDLSLDGQVCWLLAVSWRETVPTYTIFIACDLVRDS